MAITWRQNFHNVTGTNEVLRKVTLWSDGARSTSPSNYYTVRVGIATGSKIDWLGTYDGSQDTLAARSLRDLTASGSGSIDRLLRQDDALIVEVTRTGSPSPSAAFMAVEWHLELVGGNSQALGPAFQTAGYIPDQRIRAAVEGVQDSLNSSGVAKWTISQSLHDPAPEVVDEVETHHAVYEDHDSSAQTISSGSYANGNAAVTVALPAAGMTGVVHVVGQLTFRSVDAAASFIGAAIGDGTTDWGPQQGTSANLNTNVNVGVTVVDTITADTTYTLRMLKAFGSNCDVFYQSITAMVAWYTA